MALEQFGEGKCVNCGFLGKREARSTMSVCYEASIIDRLSGNLTSYAGVVTRPWCFVGEAFIGDELVENRTTEQDYETMRRILRKDKNCPSWYKWTEFVSPKEHFEEYKMTQLELKRQEFEQQIEGDRRKFELELQKSNEQERKRSDKIMIGLTIALILFALFQVVAAFLGITNDSWVIKDTFVSSL